MITNQRDFRVYCLDPAGKIASAGWVQAANLEAAITRVREQHGTTSCEIWEGAKCLAKVPAA